MKTKSKDYYDPKTHSTTKKAYKYVKQSKFKFVDLTSIDSKIYDRDYQTRKTGINSYHLRDLQGSIKSKGLEHPVALESYTDNTGKERYKILSGHHRTRCYINLNYPSIPAFIVTFEEGVSKILNRMLFEQMDNCSVNPKLMTNVDDASLFLYKYYEKGFFNTTDFNDKGTAWKHAMGLLDDIFPHFIPRRKSQAWTQFKANCDDIDTAFYDWTNSSLFDECIRCGYVDSQIAPRSAVINSTIVKGDKIEFLARGKSQNIVKVLGEFMLAWLHYDNSIVKHHSITACITFDGINTSNIKEKRENYLSTVQDLNELLFRIGAPLITKVVYFRQLKATEKVHIVYELDSVSRKFNLV